MAAKVTSPVLVPLDEPEKLDPASAPAQVRFPVELATVQPVEALPPAKRISPVPLLPILIFPVETLPMLISPVPLEFTVRASLVPDEMAATAIPPPAAAEVTFKPVAELAVLVSTWKA